MTRPGSPFIDRLALARELRRYRKKSGMSLEAAASRALDASAARLSRIETGKQTVGPRDVRDLCILYGVDENRTNELLELAVAAREVGWWEEYSEIDVDESTLISYETSAAHIRQFESNAVPALLQTPEYAKMQLMNVTHWGSSHTAPEFTENLLELKERRQRTVLRTDGPRLSFIVDETALLRISSPNVASDQISTIQTIVDQCPQVELRILPIAHGLHPGQLGSFTLLSMVCQGVPDVVHVETLAGDVFINDPKEFIRFGALYRELQKLCLTPEESRRYLQRRPYLESPSEDSRRP
jgi:transcriptional regulator with XRE-family HTH domain